MIKNTVKFKLPVLGQIWLSLDLNENCPGLICAPDKKG